MRRAEAFLLLLVSLSATPAMAQATSRPTEAPAVTADSKSWYVAREPIQVGADFYYPAGATVFFDGNTMVQTGTYEGVPLFSDKTLEPFSVVYVPVARGSMQPYERRRDGDIAGTTASRAPSFPVAVTGDTTTEEEDAAVVATPTGGNSEPVVVGTGGTVAGAGGTKALTRPVQKKTSVATLIRPRSDDGLWIQYAGAKWVSAGEAVQLTSGRFRQVGRYAGFPVYAREGTSDHLIYVPTRDGFVAPYKAKP